ARSPSGVRSGGGVPSAVFTARTVIVLPLVEPMVRWLGLAVTVTVKVAGGTGTFGFTGAEMGSVGDFEEQAAATASKTASRKRWELRILVMALLLDRLRE